MCEFCDSLELQKTIDKSWNNGWSDKSMKLFHDYTVAIVTHSWTKQQGKRKASRIVDYRKRGLGYKLNFCPECGKKIGGSKKL